MSSRQLDQFRRVHMGPHVHQHKVDQAREWHQDNNDNGHGNDENVDIIKQKNGKVSDGHKYQHIDEDRSGHNDRQSETKRLEDNFRPLQPLNGRKVLDIDTSRKRFTNDKDDGDVDDFEYEHLDRHPPVGQPDTIEQPVYQAQLRSGSDGGIKSAKWLAIRSRSSRVHSWLAFTIAAAVFVSMAR